MNFTFIALWCRVLAYSAASMGCLLILMITCLELLHRESLSLKMSYQTVEMSPRFDTIAANTREVQLRDVDTGGIFEDELSTNTPKFQEEFPEDDLLPLVENFDTLVALRTAQASFESFAWSKNKLSLQQ